MTCDDVRPQLTAYLDGELEDERGSAVRGHLRTCDDCRRAADDEGVLRDGLQNLPALDVPASLWAGVQRRLAEEEVADSKQPRWRLVLASWKKWLPTPTPRLAIASGALAVIVCVWAWRHTHHHGEGEGEIVTVPAPLAVNPPVHAPAVPVEKSGDVAEEVAALPKQTSDSYAQAAQELLALAQDARGQWTADRQQTFDTKLASLTKAVTDAPEGRARHSAYRALIRYLERVTTRDEVAFAEVTPR
ncbi:MAG: zf-HC2 domain-containing protein [Kofleriaceae bacterium]